MNLMGLSGQLPKVLLFCCAKANRQDDASNSNSVIFLLRVVMFTFYIQG